ncbi:MAG TPA: type VI secretion system contractile sheath large subunit [Labilithrix sp.]|nr:type VI secretion system contractile sheath large subunit [Labilithrix sp.]
MTLRFGSTPPPDEVRRERFHILVVAPLRASDAEALDAPWAEPLSFERATFDDTMAAVAPAIAIAVPDPIRHGKPVRVDLRLSSMRAFRPDAMLAEVPLLRALAANTVRTAQPNEPAGGSLVDDILSSMESAGGEGSVVSGVDGALASLFAHPTLRALERAWRGLHFLVSRAERDKVTVSAIAAAAEELDSVLERVARNANGRPIDLIVVDHALGSSPRDLGRLESYASRAEGIGAPLVLNGLPDLVGIDDLAALGRTQRRLRSSDDARASAFRSVAARETMRWVALALNGALTRPRHEGAVARAEGVRLDEQDDLFIGPAHLVAALVAASVARTGWPCAISGPPHGVITNLAVRTWDDRGTSVATPLEVLVTDEAAAEAAAAGLILFASRPNTDTAVLAHAPTLHRARSTMGGTSPAAMHGLADQLFVARTARAIEMLAATIPGDTSEAGVRDAVRAKLAELFGDAHRKPELEISVTGAPACVEVTVRPRGFHGVRLEEVTFGAPLGAPL